LRQMVLGFAIRRRVRLPAFKLRPILTRPIRLPTVRLNAQLKFLSPQIPQINADGRDELHESFRLVLPGNGFYLRKSASSAGSLPLARRHKLVLAVTKVGWFRGETARQPEGEGG